MPVFGRAVLLLPLLVWGAPSLACEMPSERAVYRIEHETFGDIGREVLTFSCRGEQLAVDTTVDVSVRMLFLTIYRYQARYHEVWQGDRLLSFESHTDDNGKVLEVSARAVGGRIVIDGPNGRNEAPLTLVPDHPWNRDVIGRGLLLDPIDGTLRRVKVTDVGEVQIQEGGHRTTGREYRVSGDVEFELWYDENGAWLKWRMPHDRGAVTMIRQLPRVVAAARAE